MPQTVDEFFNYFKLEGAPLALPLVYLSTKERFTAVDYFESLLEKSTTFERRKPGTLSYTSPENNSLSFTILVQSSSGFEAEYNLYSDAEQFVSFKLEVE